MSVPYDMLLVAPKRDELIVLFYLSSQLFVLFFLLIERIGLHMDGCKGCACCCSYEL